MYEDDPQDKVHDVLGEAVFGDHPLGRAIIGRAEVIARHAGRRHRRASTPRATCPATSSSRPPGSVDHDALVALAERQAAATGDRAAAPLRRAPGRAARRACASSARTPSSTTSASAARASPRDDERRFALRVLDTDPRRLVLLAAVPGGAREARAGLRGLLLRQPLRATRARSASTSARARTTSPRRCEVIGRRARADARGRRSAPRSCERAKENVKGRHRALAGVDGRADEPPRLLGPRRACRCSRSTSSSRASTPSTLDDVARAGRASCRRPSGCRPPAIGPDEERLPRRARAAGAARPGGVAA